MNKFNKLLQKVGVDKAIHFLCGFVITSLGYPFSMNVTLITFAAALFAAVEKEIYDFYTYGVFDIRDMAATMIGATAALVYAYVTFLTQITIFCP